nr:MAG TPA: hypothetical protein [Caudoviricetes sp.]
MSNVENLVKQINASLNRVSSSGKDEVDVMRAMMNDTKYHVTLYPAKEEYNPSSSLRGMCANIISSTTNISKNEAKDLVQNYEFTKSDAETMVEFSKEYITTYMKTGRKLPLGGREKSNVILQPKHVKSREINIPKSDGVKADKKIKTPEYEGIKVSNKIPKWAK